MARLVAARSGVPAVSSLTLAAPWPTKIAPQTATPTATPTWRKVSLMPAAMPLRSFGTTLSATSPITGLRSPTPAPRTRNPPSSVVHSESGADPGHQQQPEPDTASPH